MSRSKHRATHGQLQPRDTSPIQKTLEHTPHDLDDLTRLWPRACEQLDPRVDPPPHPSHEISPEELQRRADEDRDVKDEKILNAHAGIEPFGVSPSPAHVGALDSLAIAETGLLALGDLLTLRVRGGQLDPDGRPGPHRLSTVRHDPTRPVDRREIDHLGYLLRLGYGKRVHTGKTVDDAVTRKDRHPALAAIAWIRTALPAVTDMPTAEYVALEVKRIRGRVRAVIGLPDMQVRLSPCCFVCDQPSLRMNVDKLYVECRNPGCQPTPMQCTYKGPRGEPRWYRTEWRTLSKRLGVNVEDHLLQIFDQGQAS